MCDIDSGEYCTVWRESEHTSRKKRKCDCCTVAIEIGQRYLSHFSVFEGDACRLSLCMACTKDRAAFSAAHEDYMPNPAGFREALEECIEDNTYDGPPESSETRRWKRMLKRIVARKQEASL